MKPRHLPRVLVRAKSSKRSKQARVFFLGAGASAADGLPTTSDLNYCISDYLLSSRSDGLLRSYYSAIYGLKRADFRPGHRAWRKYVKDGTRPKGPTGVPDLIETLSLIDITIAENRSFGPARGSNGRGIEFDALKLREIRREIITALHRATREAAYKKQKKITETFISMLRPEDVVITTNWDVLLDRGFSKREKLRTEGGWLLESSVNYGTTATTPVNWRGDTLRKSDQTNYTLLKLHGGLNWVECARCANLYVNVESTVDPSEAKGRTRDERCACDARLSGVMITPSYIKDYGSAHLKSVWFAAQRALERSLDWTFIGYSLPPDDYHIRGMLLRAFLSRQRSYKKATFPSITVVSHSQNKPLADRFSELFRRHPPQFLWGGMKDYLGQRMRK